ncbi:hypothetical protein HGRIS_004878 [Hohenbuehelia grisea]|uniref:Uncharacterized protein n=1 Tax=Hohenbuehelia grisea TaxID=104357 RepID=A0ABR3JEX4_9AGAR
MSDYFTIYPQPIRGEKVKTTWGKHLRCALCMWFSSHGSSEGKDMIFTPSPFTINLVRPGLTAFQCSALYSGHSMSITCQPITHGFMLILVLLLVSLVSATTWSPNRFAIVTAFPDGSNIYIPADGTIRKLGTFGRPNNVSAWNLWVDQGTLSQFITGVARSSNVAAVGYLSPVTGAGTTRLFYQLNNGDIQAAWRPGINNQPLWQLDAIIASGVPLGTPISAMQQQLGGLGTAQTTIVQWVDANGLLTQRFSTTDSGGWSSPVILNTP